MDEPLPKFVILVPLNYNDGREVPNEIILDFYEEVFSLGGGITEAGTVKGAYRMKDGTKQIDHSLEIWIGIPEEFVADLKQLVGRLGAKLGQETMYFERTGSKIEFIPPQT
jgi:hypothetical protein